MGQQHSERGPLANYAYFSPLYFLAVGVLYLWGYWPRFGINILEYADLTDIIKTAAYPVASFFVFFALGAVFGEFLTADELPPGGGANTWFGRLFRKVFPYIGAAYTVGTLILFFIGPEEKWRFLPVLVTLPLYWVARRHGLLSDLISNDSARSILIFLLAALPFFSYGHGRIKAEHILVGEEFTYARTAIGDFPLNMESITKRPRYLGVAGDYAFFYVPERRSTFVVSLEDIKTLELVRFPLEDGKQVVAPASTLKSSAPAEIRSNMSVEPIASGGPH